METKKRHQPSQNDPSLPQPPGHEERLTGGAAPARWGKGTRDPAEGRFLSRDTYARIRQHVVVEEAPGITLKGIDEPVSAYVLKGFS